jgi:polyketide synthase 12
MTAKKQKEPIAIVGVGCRFPGGIDGPESFWKFLKNGGDAISDIPEDRFNISSYYDPNPNKAGKLKSKKGGFIQGIDQFDANFFNIFPNEAQRIDPQQRLLLEVSYEAMEDAGIPWEKISNTRTGVYMGVFMNDYWDIQASSLQRDHISPHVPMGVSLTAIANRLSYVFNLKGPSMTIDTACSSSLVCVHLACQSIWNGESDQALAGGVNLIIRPESSIMMSKGNFLSPDGYCKSFDSRANGYVRSEGSGVIVLKPLSKALEDGDQIYSVIRGSAVNSDGHTHEGFTVPSVEAQVEMLRTAYEDAQVDPTQVVFVEAHGTGTPVGDPIETNAFSQVIGKGRPVENPCVIGSVKSNIGHLEAAAGIAGLIKLTLILKNKQIPANLHFIKPNPKIPFEQYRLRVPVSLEEIKKEGPIYGGVNSFGAGGTNAHIVLESFVVEKQVSATSKDARAFLFSVSGKSKEALIATCQRYVEYLPTSHESLRDIAFTSLVRKSSLDHKLTITARTKEELLSCIQAFLNDETRPEMTYAVTEKRSSKPKIGFVYSGQGPQWYAMGRELLQRSEVFRTVVEKIEVHFKKISGWSLLEEMNKSEEESRVSDTRIAQPAIMAVQVGLTEVWKSWGIEADGYVGHSIGEVAAAYASGALTLEQAVEVIYHRSRGQNRATGKGKMLAIGLSHKDALKAIAGHEAKVSIAAVNGPVSVALAGDEDALDIIDKALQAKDIFTRYLKVNVPFHSHHMEPLKEELIESLNYLVPARTNKPLYSTVSGKLENGDHLVSEYWYRNVRETVFFSDAVQEMLNDGFDTFIEIAPHPILSVGVNELIALNKTKHGIIVASLRRGSDEEYTLQTALGTLYNHGVSIDWNKFFGAGKFVKTVSYAWQHQRYWFETQEHLEKRLGNKDFPFVVGKKKAAVDTYNELWEIDLNKSTYLFLEDHKVEGTIIFPGTGHLEMATEVGKSSLKENFSHLADIQLESALFLPDEGESPEVRLEITSDEGNYTICSRPRYSDDKSWLQHSKGRIVAGMPVIDTTKHNVEELRKRITEPVSVSDFYVELKEGGLNYGETFRCVQKLWTNENEVLGALSLPESISFEAPSFFFHPALLDACLHTLFAARKSTVEEKRGIYLPVQIEKYQLHQQPSKHVWVHIDVKEASAEFLRGDYFILNEEGYLVAEIKGLTCKYVEGSRSEHKDDLYRGMYEYQWKAMESAPAALNSAKQVVMVLADKGRLYQPLVDALDKNNVSVVMVHPGETYNRVNANQFVIIPELISEFETMFSLLQTDGVKISKIVNFWALDYASTEEQDASTLEKQQHVLNLVTLNVLKSVASLPYEPGVVLLNRYLEKIKDNDLVRVNLSSQLGFGRVLINEFPFIPMTMLNLGTVLGSSDWETLCSVLLADQKKLNPELAIRGAEIFERKLTPISESLADETYAQELPAIQQAFKPVITEYGMIDNIKFRSFRRKKPTGKQVEIEVRASGLNFKDVMNVMGLLSDEAVDGGVAGKKLGLECSGVVVAVGNEVSSLKVGDEVMAWSSESFAGYTITDESCVVAKPSTLSFEEAASVTVTYLTAYYAMNYLGRVSKGERVLIHSATGGVGLAAIQLARLAGAEIFATAGNEEKRKLLRDMGIKYVYDSRNLDFSDKILADTQGMGVDFVLNSLSGKAISHSIRCLAPFGRFVEIGKTDIYKDAKLAMKRFGNNLSFFGVDLDRLMLQKPVLGKQLYVELKQLFEDKKLKVEKVTVYPVQQLSDALSFLSKGLHTGKVVVRMNDKPLKVYPSKELQLDPEASYLVTGGASGFGLELARWLATKGARYLVLVSRSGCKTDYDKKVILELEKQGVRVGLMNVDISKYSEVEKVIATINAEMPVLKGIIHSAAVLKDATLKNMDAERFDSVYNPKVMGAWNFHLATKDLPIDFFLMLSSISSIFGLPGQSNYSSANNFLDRLAQYRQEIGLKACSVNLGVLGMYAGMSKEGEAVLNVLANQGWFPLSLSQVTSKIETLLVQQPSYRMAANLDWKRFKDFFGHLQQDPRFAEIIQESGAKGAGGKGGSSLADQVLQLPEAEQPAFLQTRIAESLAKILGTSVDRLDINESVSKIGLDSLMLNQLRNWIQQKLEINFPLMRIAKGPSIVELATQLLAELTNVEASDAEADTTGMSTADDIEIVNDWLVKAKSNTRRNIQGRVFCIHPVGAGASMFSHFMYNAPTETEVLAFQLPGRENRKDETNFEEVPLVVEQMAKAMLPLLDKPFVIMGHSFGGILGYELIRYLKLHYNLMPTTLFISGTIAPQLTKKWKERDVISQTAVFTNSEERLLALMTYIDDVEFLKRILPVMRKDMPLIMNYQYVPGEKLPIPIVAYAADKDEVVTAAEVAQWEAQTESSFELEVVPGDHWFLSRNRDQILEKLASVAKEVSVS